MEYMPTNNFRSIFIPKCKPPKVPKAKIDFNGLYMIIPTYEGSPTSDTIILKNNRLHLQSHEYNYKHCIPTLFKSKEIAQKLIEKLYDKNEELKYKEFEEFDLKIIRVKIYE